MKHTFKDLTGLVCGQLTVLEFSNFHGEKRRRYWKCICSCGNISYVRGDALTGAIKVKSCGCIKGEAVRRFQLKHGHNKSKGQRTSEYNSWDSMIQRCTNPNNRKYRIYGGRGISICERWLKFENFIEDMGLKPSPKHSLDRFPNKDGNYEPSNCRWATIIEQNRNTSQNRWFEYEGKKYLMQDLVTTLGMPFNKIRYHLQVRGRSMEELLVRKDLKEAKRLQYRGQKCNVWLEYNGQKLILNDWAKVFQVTQTAIRMYLKRHTFEEAYHHYMNKLKKVA